MISISSKRLINESFEIMKDSVTFAQALKNRKLSSSHSSRALTPDLSSITPSPGQLPWCFSPKAQTVTRKNTTLKDIFKEYSQLSSNQYILRLGRTGKEERYLKFDDWISSQGQSQGQRGAATVRKESCWKLREQIEKEIEKIRHKTNLSSHPEELESKIHSENKFSFSNFYSEESSSPEQGEQVITNVSIMNNLGHNDGVQEEENQSGKMQEVGKENINPNSSQVRGLQFSKKRKYKAKKKMNKA